MDATLSSHFGLEDIADADPVVFLYPVRLASSLRSLLFQQVNYVCGSIRNAGDSATLSILRDCSARWEGFRGGFSQYDWFLSRLFLNLLP